MDRQTTTQDLERQLTVLRIRITELEKWKHDVTKYLFINWKKDKK